MTVDQIKEQLGLVAHPEGGYYIQTYKSAESIRHEALDTRYPGARATGTAIYYLLEPGTFSELHRLKSDEIFHFYLGDPVEQLQLWPDGSSRLITLGSISYVATPPNSSSQRTSGRERDWLQAVALPCSAAPSLPGSSSTTTNPAPANLLSVSTRPNGSSSHPLPVTSRGISCYLQTVSYV